MRHALTFSYNGHARVLASRVKVCTPILQGEKVEDKPLKEYVAIWDTGATGSAVTKKVVDELGLQPSGMAEVRHADGKSSVNTYLVGIALPNNVAFNDIRVTEVKLIPNDGQKEEDQPQLLIGMDIIGSGDFAVTSFGGQTTLSFQVPSQKKIDFVPAANYENIIEAKKNNRPFRGGRR